MRAARRWLCLLPLALAVGAGACADRLETREQTAQGPTAREVFTARSQAVNGRDPSFDEIRIWEQGVDARVAQYLREHPELEQSPRYLELRFWRQVTPGASRPEVEVLLEAPSERTIDPALLAVLADRHWDEVGRTAREAWVYADWVVFFDEAAVVNTVRRIGALTPRYD
jgi:hypothetical protein